MRALVVEDDPVTAQLVRRTLEAEGVVVEATDSGEDAVELGKLYDFDVVVLDLRLPDLDGNEVLRGLRTADVRTAVLVLSSVQDQNSKVDMLTAGADDFLTKPFDRSEFLARVQAVVRRSRGHAASTIKIGRMCIDLNERAVTIDGRSLHVTGKEYGILELLALRKGMTLTKNMFLDHLYGGIDEPEQKIIDVFICKLRKKIAAISSDAHGIETVWGQGYVMKDPQPEHAQLAEDSAPFSPKKGPGHSRAAAKPKPSLDELDLLYLELLREG